MAEPWSVRTACIDEVDTDARRFYERHGFVNIEPGETYRMLCYLRVFST